MSNSKTMDLLSLAMGELDPDEVVKLTRVLESDNAAMDQALPQDKLLEALRPQLRKLRPKRTLNAMRVFCFPFEDILINTDVHGVRHGRIDRAFIAPAWGLLAEDEIAARVNEPLEHLEAALSSGEKKSIEACSMTFWAVAGEAYSEFLEKTAADPVAEKKLRQKLGHDKAIRHIRDITGMLQVAPLILSMRQELVDRPVVEAEDRHVRVILDHFAKAAAKEPGREYYVMLAAQGCLLHAADIFQILKQLPEEEAATVARLGSYLGDVVFDDLDLAADKLEELVAGGGDEADLTAVVKTFSAELNNVADVLALTGDADWKSRMTESMQRVGDVVCGEILEGSVQTVLQAYAAGDEEEGGVHWPEEEEIAAAERRITAVCDCVLMAEPLAIKTQADRIHRDLRQQLSGLCNTIIEGSRERDADGDAASFRFMTAIKMLEMAAGPDQAEEMLEKGLAAMCEADDGD